MVKFRSRSLEVSARQMTKLMATAVAFESMVDNWSGVGDVAIGKAEQL